MDDGKRTGEGEGVRRGKEAKEGRGGVHFLKPPQHSYGRRDFSLTRTRPGKLNDIIGGDDDSIGWQRLFGILHGDH